VHTLVFVCVTVNKSFEVGVALPVGANNYSPLLFPDNKPYQRGKGDHSTQNIGKSRRKTQKPFFLCKHKRRTDQSLNNAGISDGGRDKFGSLFYQIAIPAEIRKFNEPFVIEIKLKQVDEGEKGAYQQALT
jgi:hypothetical protein